MTDVSGLPEPTGDLMSFADDIDPVPSLGGLSLIAAQPSVVEGSSSRLLEASAEAAHVAEGVGAGTEIQASTITQPESQAHAAAQSSTTAAAQSGTTQQQSTPSITYQEDRHFTERNDGRRRIYEAIILPTDWDDQSNINLTHDLGRLGSGKTIYTRVNAVANDTTTRRCGANHMTSEPVSDTRPGVDIQCDNCKAARRICWYLEMVDIDPETKKLSRKARRGENVPDFETDENGKRYVLKIRKPRSDDDDDDVPATGPGDSSGNNDGGATGSLAA